jgi:hypothetical protein
MGSTGTTINAQRLKEPDSGASPKISDSLFRLYGNNGAQFRVGYPFMNRCVAHQPSPQAYLPRWAHLARRIACLTLLAALAACGSHSTYRARTQYNPSRYYPPPGPASDPWGPYIREASGRFGVPELWIRRVMHQESGGQQDVISWAGAMGLMQVMPETYAGLRDRYSLGDDPYDPHNNILAGTAYLREMYDRYGSPGFLAAYNAGPNRLDSYLNNGRPLPEETVNYVASIAPLLGPGTPMSGPLAVYAGPATQMASLTQMASARPTPAGCDPDAAYNPNGPCTPLRPAAEQPVVVAAVASYAPSRGHPSQGGGYCDPDAAYDPTHPCQPAPAAAVVTPVAYAQSYSSPSYSNQSNSGSADATSGGCDPDGAYDPAHPCQPMQAAPAAVVAEPGPQPVAHPLVQQPLVQQRMVEAGSQGTPRRMAQPIPARRPAYATEARPLQERMAQPVAFTSGPPPGRWAIQVGAFATLSTAQSAAENARSAVPDILRTTKVELPATTPFGNQIAFRARLFGLSSSDASAACARLSGRGMACMTVPPSRDSF